MKYSRNTLAIISIFFLSAYAKAQMDTLSYLKQFEVNKTKYIGKPLSVLLDDMTKIQPKFVFNDSPFTNKNIRTTTRFKFDEKNLFKPTAITLSIDWQTPILSTEETYYRKKNKSKFTEEERAFYGSKILKEIKVYR